LQQLFKIVILRQLHYFWLTGRALFGDNKNRDLVKIINPV
jgi:hypothetical protein